MRGACPLLVCAVALLANVASAVECDTAKIKYAELNRPLRVEYAGENAYLSTRDARTDKIHRFVVDELSNRLNFGTPPYELPTYIHCLQDLVPENAAGIRASVTNLPVAYRLSQDGRAIAIGYQIYRGWAAVPDDRNYFEVYRDTNGHWNLMGSVGSDFDGSTFFVNPINAGKPGEDWFLFSGNSFGSTGGRLHLEVVGFDGKSLTVVWQSSIKGSSLESVAGGRVVITGEETNEAGRAEDFREEFHVVPDGLKSVSRQVIKAY